MEAYLFAKSSRSSILATVILRASSSASPNDIFENHSLLRCTSVRDSSKTLNACSRYVRLFASTSSGVRTGRRAERPLGSPMHAV